MLHLLVDTTKFSRSVSLALRSLWLHKLRSTLSVLGIIIGNLAVITLMAFGEGSKQEALDAIRRLGATSIVVRSVKPPDESSTGRRSFILAYGLLNEDYQRMLTLPDISHSVRMRVFPQEIRRAEKLFNGRLVGTTPDYALVNKIELSSGRFLTEKDEYYMENVCVLGADTADYLFPYENPLGQTINLGSQYYRVVGVMKDRMPTGGTGGSLAAETFNTDVYIPLNTCNARYGEAVIIRQSGSFNGEKVQLHQVTLTLDTTIDTPAGRDKVRATGKLIQEMLEKSHFPKKDFAVTVPLDRLEQAEETQASYTRLLAVIASISLLVGGIGIMNIMLATVTERTREIGIRRALGAKRRDITMQFLIESVVQTSMGGASGVLFGLIVIFAGPPLYARLVNGHLTAQLHPWSIPLSLSVSIGVGVLFGLYPAYRAAQLDPIEALRHE
jgi:putative ABC transport system permease protein